MKKILILIALALAITACDSYEATVTPKVGTIIVDVKAYQVFDGVEQVTDEFGVTTSVTRFFWYDAKGYYCNNGIPTEQITNAVYLNSTCSAFVYTKTITTEVSNNIADAEIVGLPMLTTTL